MSLSVIINNVGYGILKIDLSITIGTVSLLFTFHWGHENTIVSLSFLVNFTDCASTKLQVPVAETSGECF